MHITCDKCAERFDTNDVVIEGGRIECPRCKAGLLLDQLADRTASCEISPADAALAAAQDETLPRWLKVSETGGALEIRWRWSQSKAKSHVFYVLFFFAVVVAFGAVTVAAFQQSASIRDLVVLILLDANFFILFMAFLTDLCNSTAIRSDGLALTVSRGPLPGGGRPLRVDVSRIDSLTLERRGNTARYDYSVICHMKDGERTVLDDSIRDRAMARFVRRRLDEAIGG